MRKDIISYSMVSKQWKGMIVANNYINEEKYFKTFLEAKKAYPLGCLETTNVTLNQYFLERMQRIQTEIVFSYTENIENTENGQKPFHEFKVVIEGGNDSGDANK